MKLVYIVGPWGDFDGYNAIDRRLANAREAATWLVENRIGYISPHLNSAHFEAVAPSVPVEFWYEMDIALMPIADALLVLDGWENSKGTQAEIAEWEKSGKPIFYDIGGEGALLRWAKGDQA